MVGNSRITGQLVETKSSYRFKDQEMMLQSG